MKEPKKNHFDEEEIIRIIDNHVSLLSYKSKETIANIIVDLPFQSKKAFAEAMKRKATGKDR